MVMMISRTVLAVLLMVAAAAANAQQSFVRRVLVPVYVTNVPGANGSMWSSSFAVANLGTETVYVDPNTLADTFLAAGFTDSIRPTRGNSPRPGVVVSLMAREREPDVAFTLRIQDVSRQGETWGTTLPVVAPEEFSSTVSLVDVPRIEGFRSMLRVYALDLQAPADVRITLYEGHVSHRPFGTHSATMMPGAHAAEPAYAQVDLTSLLPVGHDRRETATVRIESLDGTPIWAFISVTHNVSQHMTAIVP